MDTDFYVQLTPTSSSNCQRLHGTRCFFSQRLLSSQRRARSLSGSGAPAVEAQTAADLFGDDDLEVTRQTDLFLEDSWNCPVTRQLRDFANLNMAQI